MKRVLISALVLVFILVSCGAKSVEMQTVKDTVSTVTFRDLTYEPDMDMTLSQYNLENGVIDHYRIMSGTGATAEEITVFKLADNSYQSGVVEACEERKEDVYKMYETYKPAEVPMIENTQIFSQGEYVFYVCADDSEEIKQEISQLFE